MIPRRGEFSVKDMYIVNECGQILYQKGFYSSHILLPLHTVLSSLRSIKWACFKSSTIVIIFLSYFVNLKDIMDISLLSFTVPAPLGKLNIFEYYLAIYISSSANFLLLFFSYWEKLFAFLLICRSFLCTNHILTVCFSSVL